MTRKLAGIFVLAALTACAHAAESPAALSGYAPFEAVTVTYQSGQQETLRCGTTGVLHQSVTAARTDTVMICGEMKVPHLLFPKAAWLVHEVRFAGENGTLKEARRYRGRDCAIFEDAKTGSAWRCRRWSKLASVGNIVSGKSQPYPANEMIYYKVRIPNAVR